MRKFKYITNLLFIFLLLSPPSVASIHLDSSYTCIKNEMVDKIKQHGDYELRFKLKNHDQWFNVYYHTNYNGGRAILKLLHASMNLGLPIFADNGGSSCSGGTVTNVALTTNENITTAGGLL